MIYSVRHTKEAGERFIEADRFSYRSGPVRSPESAWGDRRGSQVPDHLPFSCRKAEGSAGNSFVRELLIPFGNAGCVALFEIEDAGTVTILAVRHQREDDYH
jgi:hypothetical protein